MNYGTDSWLPSSEYPVYEKSHPHNQHPENVNVLHYENFVQQNTRWIREHPLRNILEIPSTDVQVKIIPRKLRTNVPLSPEEPLPRLPSHIRDCVDFYLSNWSTVTREYQFLSSSSYRSKEKVRLKDLKQNEYEIDSEIEYIEENTQRDSENCSSLNESESDELLTTLLHGGSFSSHMQHTLDCRQENLFSLCPFYKNCADKRTFPKPPEEHMGIRIQVDCLKFVLEPEIEPIFFSMALYDVKERKKISENFYFDMNSPSIQEMLSDYTPCVDISSLSHSCIFNITYPNPDIFVVVRLEKVPQTDMNDSTKAYVKKNKNPEKAKANAEAFCKRLGKFRMPFAWNAVCLSDVIQRTVSQRHNLECIGTEVPLQNRNPMKAGVNDGLDNILRNFKPCVMHFNEFYKQDDEQLSDDDLLKNLIDIQRPYTLPSPLRKKRSILPGSLELCFSPCSTESKNCLSPEMEQIFPYCDEKARPTKEVLEFPQKEILVPHFLYRNFLYVYPKGLSMSGKHGSGKNIAVKIQLMKEHTPLPLIFGKSSCSQFTTEMFTVVSHHAKNPTFYDEIKIKLPGNLGEDIFLVFTFYRIVCQPKATDFPVELPIGSVMLQVFRDGELQIGNFNLAIKHELPTISKWYYAQNPEVHNETKEDRSIFHVTMTTVSSVYAQDKPIDRFFNLCSGLEDGSFPAEITQIDIETELKIRMFHLKDARRDSLIKFLPIIFNKLVSLIVNPPVIKDHLIHVEDKAFMSMAEIVEIISDLEANSLERSEDCLNRANLLVAYITYQCFVPDPVDSQNEWIQSQAPFDSTYSQTDSYMDHPEVKMTYSDPDESQVNPGGEQIGQEVENLSNLTHCNFLHEELVKQWRMVIGINKDIVAKQAWFFFDMIYKSMVEYLDRRLLLIAARNARFPPKFVADLRTMVSTMIIEIFSKKEKHLIHRRLNLSLAFFLCDLLSIMDRGFVFSLIETYYRQVTHKIKNRNHSEEYFLLLLDFISIVCSYEHFVALNLLAAPPCNFLSNVVENCELYNMDAEQNYFQVVKNSPIQFGKRNFLIYLIFKCLRKSLQMNNNVVHSKVMQILYDLLSSHDTDPRFRDFDRRGFVASLYLPLLEIIVSSTAHLNVGYLDGQNNITGSHESIMKGTQDTKYMLRVPSRNELDADTREEMMYSYTHSGTQGEKEKPHNTEIDSICTHKLLISILWILKNVNNRILKNWLVSLPLSRIEGLLRLLEMCLICFEYKGQTYYYKKGSELKQLMEKAALLETAKTVTQKKGTLTKQSKQQWKKYQRMNSSQSVVLDEEINVGEEILFAANLAAESSFIVMDSLILTIEVASETEYKNIVLGMVLKAIIAALERNLSASVLKYIFSTLRSMFYKFPNLLFDESELFSELCLCLLKHSFSTISAIRSEASASIYFLMRQSFVMTNGANFSRLKLQLTLSLSSLATSSKVARKENLRRALKTIIMYAETDNNLQASVFPSQVNELVHNLYMILSDTMKIEQFQKDPEMIVDLMYRIAKGYQSSPYLRLVWLTNMAHKHLECSNQTEAAMCLVHSAALVAEYLDKITGLKHLPDGAVSFQNITPNALEECIISEDVFTSAGDETTFGKYFTEEGLVGLLEQAATTFSEAGLYEMVNEVYKIMVPIAEAHRDFKKLANIHGKLQKIFTEIDKHKSKRELGTYFRVVFYGAGFGDLDCCEFVYKEPMLTKLSEIFSRLQSFYEERFSSDKVVIVKHSNTLNVQELNPNLHYIQITYVEPYFEMYELQHRKTHFERNYCVNKFVYATPFTIDGRTHGKLHEQYKRKTILTTLSHFPYVKTRIPIVQKEEIILCPIEVAIEDIQKKTKELSETITRCPPDTKMLQMVLQGCIGTTVNQGPLEVAQVFLSNIRNGEVYPNSHQNKLRLCFRNFCRRCEEALTVNGQLIDLDQKLYHRELCRSYAKVYQYLTPLLNTHVMKPHPGNRQTASLSIHEDFGNWSEC